MCALVTAMVGLISTFSFLMMSLKSQGPKCPQGSMATIFLGSDHVLNGPILVAGSVLVKSGLWSVSS